MLNLSQALVCVCELLRNNIEVMNCSERTLRKRRLRKLLNRFGLMHNAHMRVTYYVTIYKWNGCSEASLTMASYTNRMSVCPCGTNGSPNDAQSTATDRCCRTYRSDSPTSPRGAWQRPSPPNTVAVSAAASVWRLTNRPPLPSPPTTCQHCSRSPAAPASVRVCCIGRAVRRR